MKVTFILKDLSQAFYEGSFGIIGLNNLNPLEKFLYLLDRTKRRELKITMKLEAGRLMEQIELNQKIKKGITVLSGILEPRKGYKLATFEVC